MSEKYKEKILAVLNEAQERLNFLEPFDLILSGLDLPVSETSSKGYIDFDNLEHDQIIQVIKAFPGEWKKEYNTETINYVLEREDVNVRCWWGKPPPNCKIVEVEEEVPAQPAGKKIVRRMQCLETGVAS